MPFDKFYKIFSIKWVYLSAILISGVGSLICGVAPNSTALVIGRAIAGVGSPGVSLGAYIIFAHSVPLRQRIKYNAFIGVSHGIGFVAGPLLGGLFTEKATWRWCFYVKLPIGGIIAGIIVIVFRVPDRAKAAIVTWKQRLGKVDLVGTLFFVSGIVCLLIALQWGGSKYEWNNARIISLFVLFAILIAVFFFEQYRVGEKATVPPRILKHRSVAAACWYAFCMRSAFLIMVYYLPVW
jgi:MFS family permease